MSSQYQLKAQKSPFQFRLGYEQVYVSPSTTNEVAEKSWIWKEGIDEYFTMRTSVTHAYTIGMSYDILKCLDINMNYKKYYREYYVWSGSSLSEGDFKGVVQDQFYIIPKVNTSLSTTLNTTSWQLGLNLHHKISKSGRWQLNYLASINRDMYENDRLRNDTPVDYQSVGGRIDSSVKDGRFTSADLYGTFTLKSYNPNKSHFVASTNLALALSRSLGKGNGLRLEFGLRNIGWLKDADLLLNENHWELNLRQERWITDFDTRNRIEKVLEKNVTHDFPLYIGGYYANLSFTCRPFRSPRDNPNYVSPGQKIKRLVGKIF